MTLVSRVARFLACCRCCDGARAAVVCTPRGSGELTSRHCCVRRVRLRATRRRVASQADQAWRRQRRRQPGSRGAPHARKPSLPPFFFASRIKPWRTLPSAPMFLQNSVITCAQQRAGQPSAPLLRAGSGTCGPGARGRAQRGPLRAARPGATRHSPRLPRLVPPLAVPAAPRTRPAAACSRARRRSPPLAGRQAQSRPRFRAGLPRAGW